MEYAGYKVSFVQVQTCYMYWQEVEVTQGSGGCHMCHLLGVDWVVIMIFMMGGVPTSAHTVVVYNNSELVRCEMQKPIYGCECCILLHTL